MEPQSKNDQQWPPLPLEAWKDTYATLHMWTQIVGKIRLALSPHINHWWQVPLYISPRGLTTTAIPYQDKTFDIEFNFIEHLLVIQTSEGDRRTLPLAERTVADFYAQLMETLRSMSIEVKIWKVPVEIPDPIPFDKDTVHSSYDPDAVYRFWQALTSIDRVLKQFRSRFIGKCSPVHFFWGSFDHAVTRFSGRRAPERVGADRITREAYSHEVISAGFWPGGGNIKGAAFYCYAAPEPDGFSSYPVRPASAFYHPELKEYILMYDDVRQADSPSESLMEFLQSTYEAGAILAKWDRESLEQPLAPAKTA